MPKRKPRTKKAKRRVMKSEMHKFKAGTLKSGRSGKKVKSRKQAIAIALSVSGQSRTKRKRAKHR